MFCNHRKIWDFLFAISNFNFPGWQFSRLLSFLSSPGKFVKPVYYSNIKNYMDVIFFHFFSHHHCSSSPSASVCTSSTVPLSHPGHLLPVQSFFGLLLCRLFFPPLPNPSAGAAISSICPATPGAPQAQPLVPLAPQAQPLVPLAIVSCVCFFLSSFHSSTVVTGWQWQWQWQ